MKASEIVVSQETIGAPPYLLCGVAENFVYNNGIRTDTLQGYTYTVASPKRRLLQVPVKIAGKKLLEDSTELPQVEFDGLELNIYVMNGQVNLKATATNIKLVEAKAKV
jgi:hypothetical protein